MSSPLNMKIDEYICAHLATSKGINPEKEKRKLFQINNTNYLFEIKLKKNRMYQLSDFLNVIFKYYTTYI